MSNAASPTTSPVVPYRTPDAHVPARALLACRVEVGGTIGAVAFLLLVMPGLYGAGAVDINTLNRLGRFLCYAIAAIGVDLIWGYCGVLSLCQAMFFCFGGYAIGMHMALHGPLDGDGVPRALFVVTSVEGFQLPAFWKPFQTLPMAALLALLVPGLVAFLFGYFTFRSRVRGVYFSIITQATVFAVYLVFGRNETRLCGTNGLTNFVSLAGHDLSKPATKLGLYLLTVVALLAVYAFCRFLVNSRLGRLSVAVRDNESRLRFAGYQPVTIKAFAFTAAAVIAGIGGMLYAPQNGIITPYKMAPVESIVMVLWVAVGGRGTLTGAVLGALLVSYTENFLTTYMATSWPFFQGGLFIAVVLLFPDGLVGAWKSFTRTPDGRGQPDADTPSTSPMAALRQANITAAADGAKA
jgi:urea transport system permease protein